MSERTLKQLQDEVILQLNLHDIRELEIDYTFNSGIVGSVDMWAYDHDQYNVLFDEIGQRFVRELVEKQLAAYGLKNASQGRFTMFNDGLIRLEHGHLPPINECLESPGVKSDRHCAARLRNTG